MTKCVIATREVADWKQALEDYNFPGIQATVSSNLDEIAKAIKDAEIAIGVPPFLAPNLDKAKNLKWVQSSFAGIDALCAPGLRTDYVLTNVKDTYGKAMAEYVFAYILGRARKVTEHKQWQSDSNWNQSESTVVEGSTMAVFGTGSIGSEIAKVAQALSMKTIGVSRSGEPANYFDEVYSSNELSKALAEKPAFLVGVLPSTEATTNYFDSGFFTKLEDSPTFINVGRGSNVNEADLVGALDSGQLSHAVLDVFKTEPLPTDSPLWRHENITITPHNSGYVPIAPVYRICEENYRRYLAGEELMHQVDFSKGY